MQQYWDGSCSIIIIILVGQLAQLLTVATVHPSGTAGQGNGTQHDTIAELQGATFAASSALRYTGAGNSRSQGPGKSDQVVRETAMSHQDFPVEIPTSKHLLTGWPSQPTLRQLVEFL